MEEEEKESRERKKINDGKETITKWERTHLETAKVRINGEIWEIREWSKN